MKRDATVVEETYKYMKENKDATLAEATKAVTKNGFTGIPFVYKYSIVILGILALTVAFAGILLVIIDPTGMRKIPESLVAIGSASVGAIVGIFAPTPDGSPKSND